MNQRSFLAKIVEKKKNITDFIGGTKLWKLVFFAQRDTVPPFSSPRKLCAIRDGNRLVVSSPFATRIVNPICRLNGTQLTWGRSCWICCNSTWRSDLPSTRPASRKSASWHPTRRASPTDARNQASNRTWRLQSHRVNSRPESAEWSTSHRGRWQ